MSKNQLLPERRSNETTVALIQNDIGYIKSTLDSVERKVDNLGTQYPTKEEVDHKIARLRDEIKPLRQILFGAVGILLTAFLLGIVNFFLKK